MHRLSIGNGYFVHVFKHKNRYAFCISEFVTASVSKSKGISMDNVVYNNNMSQLLRGSSRLNYIEKYGTLKINYDNGARVKNCVYIDDLIEFLSDKNVHVVQHYMDSLKNLKESLDFHLGLIESENVNGNNHDTEHSKVIDLSEGIRLIVRDIVKNDIGQIKDDITSLSNAIKDQAEKLKEAKTDLESHIMRFSEHVNVNNKNVDEIKVFTRATNKKIKLICKFLTYLERELGVEK